MHLPLKLPNKWHILLQNPPRLGYLHLAEANVLVLYDASAHPHVDFKTMRSTMVSAVFAVLERSEKKKAPPSSVVCEVFGSRGEMVVDEGIVGNS